MATRSGPACARRRGKSGLGGYIVLGAAIVASGFILSRPGAEARPVKAAAPIVAQFDVVNLPVPVEPVPAGIKASEIKLKMTAFPRHQVPGGALNSLGPVLDSVSVAPLPAGLPLFAENFSATAGAGNPVIEKIPAGMRAMTVKVDATSAVEGWAGSGTVVDVLLVEKNRTTVVAEKVRILSAERSVSPVEGAGSPSVPSTVTLLVTQEQCLAVNTAIPLGRIAFALRSAQDSESWRDAVFTADNLKGSAISDRHASSVSGYAAVKDSSGKKSFALTDGKWIRAETVPEGFFANYEK